MNASNSLLLERETARLDALERCCILDTPQETIYDDLAQMAAQLCDTPIAAITFIDRHRQWFKAGHGLGGLSEIARESSFCAHALYGTKDLMVVPDISEDARFADNPLVCGEPFLRFYAGVSLHSPESGHMLGSLCVLDYRPR